MAPNRRRSIGAIGERAAEQHLVGRGYRIVDRNFATRAGELDLVAADDRALVFCEVKARGPDSIGGPALPLDSIGPRKRRRVRRMAREWLHRRPPGDRPYRDELRFDAIGITVGSGGEVLSLDHVEAAF